VTARGTVVGDWTTRPRIDRAGREPNGQRLLDIRISPRGARTRFVFDLGAELATKPYDRASEQWLLYEPKGYVLTWRADRKYAYGQENRLPHQSRWRSLGGEEAASDSRRQVVAADKVKKFTSVPRRLGGPVIGAVSEGCCDSRRH
jgi:hypothetical protein